MFEGLALDRPYMTLLGFPPAAFQLLIWGQAGSGKSTLALGLARALVPHARDRGQTVLYVSSEEGPERTISSRAERLDARDGRLLISDFDTIEALKAVADVRDVGFIIIDSVTVVDPTTLEARRFFRWCRAEGVGVALVAQALKGGQDFKGDNRLAHNVDAVVRCWQDEYGVHNAETTKNRYRELAQIEIPMHAGAIEEIRDNPDCTITPQSAQCKAIFASLDESGEKEWEEKDKNGKSEAPKSGSSKRSKKRKKKTSSKSKSAASFDATLSTLSNSLSNALA